jgi:hypothetical protein
MFTTEVGNPQRAMYDVQSRMRRLGRTNHLSSILSNSKIGLERVEFDPDSKEHRLIFARFLTGGGWKNGVTFHIESPHLTVPATVINKLLAKHLAEEIAEVEAEARLGN